MLPAPIMILLVMILQILQSVESKVTGLTNIVPGLDGTVNCSVGEVLPERIFVDKMTITVIAPSHVDTSLR